MIGHMEFRGATEINGGNQPGFGFAVTNDLAHLLDPSIWWYQGWVKMAFPPIIKPDTSIH